MPTFVSGSSKEFTPAPAGTHQAVCCDVIDKGIMDTQWGQKRKVIVRWQLSELMENDKPFLVQKLYTASLNEKAVLRHDLEAWRGRAFTASELAKFDLDTVIGANAVLSVAHDTRDGKTWANVKSVAPLMKGMTTIKVVDYVREQDRTPDTPNGEDNDERNYDDDSVPF